MSLLEHSTAPAATPITTERWVLLASVLASGMAFIDATALNVALPAIQSQFGSSGSELLWVINAYALMVAALLLLGGALGDRYGHRRVLAIGVSVFAAASLLCGLAVGVKSLVVARALQGIGGALMLPGSLSLIAATFAPARRGRAIGTWSALCVVMTALGPLLGGILAQTGWWRGVFFINVPLAGACLIILRRFVPQSQRSRPSTPVDVAGGMLSVMALACLSYGLIASAGRGWNDPFAVGALLIGCGAFAAFLWVEQRSQAPLLPIDLFRDRTMVGASLMTLSLYSGIFGMMFFLSLNLLQVQGYSAVQAGSAQLPLMLIVLIVSPFAGSLVDRRGPRLPLTIGGCLAGAGFVLLALPSVTAGAPAYWISYFPSLCLLGLGLGLCAAPLSTTIINCVEQSHLGAAAAINSTLSRLSAVLGVAVLGPLVLLVFTGSLHAHVGQLPLTSPQMVSLRKQADHLADARVPAGLPEKTAAAVRVAIRESYVSAFRVASLTSAVAVAAGALCVAVLVSSGQAE